jgi:hypothetical protein
MAQFYEGDDAEFRSFKAIPKTKEEVKRESVLLGLTGYLSPISR